MGPPDADVLRSAAPGHVAMIVGIDQFRLSEELNLMPMLTQRLRGEVGGYPRWTKLLG
jgi:hypothetical protein